MPQSSELLHDIKSRQNVLITRAGLAVPSNEMKSHEIDEAIMIQFVNHVALIRHNLPCSQDGFLRSSRHCDHTVTEKDLHNGSTLWRKFLSIKKYVNNRITPLYVKNLGPDGQPPSGMTLEDILLKTRKQLHDIEQEESKARSKNPSTFKKRAFSQTWFPVEWDVFLTFGRASPNPERAFFLE